MAAWRTAVCRLLGPKMMSYLTLLAPQSHMWGQTSQTLSILSPTRDWGSMSELGYKELYDKRVKLMPNKFSCVYV